MHSKHLKPKKGRLYRFFINFTILILGLILLVEVAAYFLLDYQRGQLEKALSQASGMKAQINGHITLRLFSGPGLYMGDVELQHQGKTVVQASELNTYFQWQPLLQRRLELQTIAIEGMSLRLEADPAGLPFLPPLNLGQGNSDAESGWFQVDPPDRVVIEDSQLIITDATGRDLYQIRDFNLSLRPMDSDGNNITDWQNVMARLQFNSAQVKQLNLGTTLLEARIQPDQLQLEVVQAEALGGQARGRLLWDDRAEDQTVQIELDLEEFDAGHSLGLFQLEPYVRGKLNLQTRLQSTGANTSELIHHLAGSMKLSGTDLELVSVDLDELIRRIVKSQQYNLSDAAAYFFLGPLGLTTTKGLTLAKVARDLKQPGTTNQIVKLVTRWEVDAGIATARDVALETTRYRLALKGQIDLHQREFLGVQVAVVNNNGCAVMVQRLDGPIQSPRIEKIKILLTPAQPLIKMLEKSAKLIFNGNCTPFYSGELIAEQTKPRKPEMEVEE